jgi:biopolymer transport protein ExbB
MEQGREALALFEKGGFVMPLLLLGSILVVAIAIERYRTFRLAEADATTLRDKLAPYLETEAWAEALLVLADSEAFCAYIARAGLMQAARGSRAAELAMEGAANRGAARLRERLDLLGLMVTLAPLLGLLGTVIGMIRTFNVLNVRAGQPFAITGGVGEALVATATGLCVATLALAIQAYFRNWLDRLLNDAEETADQILVAIVERES